MVGRPLHCCRSNGDLGKRAFIVDIEDVDIGNIDHYPVYIGVLLTDSTELEAQLAESVVEDGGHARIAALGVAAVGNRSSVHIGVLGAVGCKVGIHQVHIGGTYDGVVFKQEAFGHIIFRNFGIAIVGAVGCVRRIGCEGNLSGLGPVVRQSRGPNFRSTRLNTVPAHFLVVHEHIGLIGCHAGPVVFCPPCERSERNGGGISKACSRFHLLKVIDHGEVDGLGRGVVEGFDFGARCHCCNGGCCDDQILFHNALCFNCFHIHSDPGPGSAGLGQRLITAGEQQYRRCQC